ncbi:MAG: zf-TFIIB domain-containing protein [Candidatus Levybacteria bacterium]|nr:zf-TFIIB domain-containing protein [Candidatus Levybacteria bacterium]
MRMCPRCKVELSKKRYKGVLVDECENCHGIFFDHGELEKVRDAADENLRWLDFVLFNVSDLQKVQADQGDCPKCGFAMDSLQYAGSSVILSKCSNCQGVWLDKGEFQKIIAYLEGLVAAMPASELGDAAKRQLVDVFVGPKRESEEIKDLLAVTRLLEERWIVEHPTIEKIMETYYELTPFK